MAGRGPLVTNLSKRLWSTMAVRPDAQRNPPQDPKPFHACVDVQAGAKVVNEMERTLGRVSVQTGTLASTQAAASSKQITVRVAVRSAHFLLACVRSTCLRPGPAPRPLRAPLLAAPRMHGHVTSVVTCAVQASIARGASKTHVKDAMVRSTVRLQPGDQPAGASSAVFVEPGLGQPARSRDPFAVFQGRDARRRVFTGGNDADPGVEYGDGARAAVVSERPRPHSC